MAFRFEVDELANVREMLEEVEQAANGYGALRTCVIEITLGGKNMYATWNMDNNFQWEITDSLPE